MLGMAPFAGGILARASNPKPKSDSSSSREMIRKRYFPNIVLTSHEGKKVRFYDDLIKDKIVMINLMYADCEGVCPGITLNLARVQKALGKRIGRDIFMYSITLKPEKDNPKALKEYSKMMAPTRLDLPDRRPQDIELLRRKLGIHQSDPKLDADSSQHVGMVRYGNEALQQWAAVPGLADADWIAESVLFVDWPQKPPAKAETDIRPREKGGQK